MKNLFTKCLIIMFSIAIMGIGIVNASTWVKTIDSANNFIDIPIATNDGGYIIANANTVIKLDSNWNIQFQKHYEASNGFFQKIKQTSDGGYIIAGTVNWSNSYNTSDWNHDVLMTKIDSGGDVQWNYAYGGDADEYQYSFLQANDGGYIFVGYSKSFNEPNGDVWVVKLDSTGGIQWEKSFGGSAYDRADSILQTTDNGYIIGCRTNSLGTGSIDGWLILKQANLE